MELKLTDLEVLDISCYACGGGQHGHNIGKIGKNFEQIFENLTLLSNKGKGGNHSKHCLTVKMYAKLQRF